MLLRTSVRVLAAISGTESLRCQCGGVPDLCQPDASDGALLVGVCTECAGWTLFGQSNDNWTAAQAFDFIGAEPDGSADQAPAPAVLDALRRAS